MLEGARGWADIIGKPMSFVSVENIVGDGMRRLKKNTCVFMMKMQYRIRTLYKTFCCSLWSTFCNTN